MRFVEHRPDAAAGADLYRCEGTIAEILEFPYVRAFADAARMGYRTFDGYFLSGDAALVATYDNNRHWILIGFVDGRPDLPKWSPPR